MQGKIAWHPSRKPQQLLARLTHLLTFTLSDIEKAEPESSLIELSDDDIEVDLKNRIAKETSAKTQQ